MEHRPLFSVGSVLILLAFLVVVVMAFGLGFGAKTGCTNEPGADQCLRIDVVTWAVLITGLLSVAGVWYRSRDSRARPLLLMATSAADLVLGILGLAAV